MRIAIVTESFLPQVNGVTNSVLRILEYLHDHGHDAVVLSPGGPSVPAHIHGFDVRPVTAVPLPGYRDVRVGTSTSATLESTLRDFAPDVVHLAAPFVIGYRGLLAANRLGIPTVAVYQTDVPSYASRYRMSVAEPLLWGRVRQIHRLATVTLAPSRSALRQLHAHQVPRVKMWGRGVDTVRFSPQFRDEHWRAEHARGRSIVGYVGRLAPEKQVADLRMLTDIPDTQLVIVGDGPERSRLERLLPDALFTGQLEGAALSRAFASMDVFVHPGELETFGQTLQEALASGIPVIAPAKGGPLDIVQPSHTGWLYPPGRLDVMRARVRDLLGDDAKRAAFSRSARDSTLGVSWEQVCDQLLDHYRQACVLHHSSATDVTPRSAKL